MIGNTLAWLPAVLLMFLLAFTPGIGFIEDLGRHLLLGRLILERGGVPATNLLTYTWPDYPFVNHHWLSEVVLYGLHRAVGLNGLIVFKALLMAAMLGLAMQTISPDRPSGRWTWAGVLAAVVLGFRAHVRPELFTFVGVVLYAWLFERHRRDRPPNPGHALHRATRDRGAIGRAAALLIYGWFWANAHIYFVFGLGMAGAFVLERAWTRRAWPWPETAVLAALVGVSLLNPSGWRGLLYPFSIFRDYGLALTENASPFELWQSALNPMLIVLPFLTALGLAAVLGVIVRRPRGSAEPFRLANILILLAALAAAWRMARSAPLPALAALPVIGEWCRLRPGVRRVPRVAGVLSASVVALWLASGVVDGWYTRAFPSPIGPTPFGLDDEDRYLALRGLRADGLPGRVFSDYNIGSLVEYTLWPEPGYVDNRPEAFPVSFWRGEYLPVLELGERWEQVREARGIETVAVSLPGVRDGFVRAMMSRPDWRLVHLDFLFAVWVRDTEANAAFIGRNLFTRKRLEAYGADIAARLEGLPREPFWRRQVAADQIVYELYSLACVNEFARLWPMLRELHRRYPDYQVIHELLRVCAPPEAIGAVKELMARRARWPVSVREVLDWGCVLEGEGRTDEARGVYRRGRWFFPLSPELANRSAVLRP